MEYRTFGKTGLLMSVFSLGGLRYSRCLEEPREIIPDETVEHTMAIAMKAVSVGINHIETARDYVKSENLFGMIIPKLPIAREALIVTTKIRPTRGSDEMRFLIDESLERLQLDYVDNFAIHGINTQEEFEMVFSKGGCLDGVQRSIREGTIRHVGFSTHGPLDLIFRILEADVFESVNLHFYYFFQRNLAAVKLAKSKRMGIFIISPNDKGGQLFKPSSKLCELTSPLHPMHFNARFCLSYPEITTLSFGPERPEHIDDLIGALNGNHYLTSEDLHIKLKLDQQVSKIGRDYCTGCCECLPCPERINIPEVLRFRNMDVAYDLREFGRYRYNMFNLEDTWIYGNFGDKCSDCGDCLPRCPVKLDIPLLLRDAHNRFHEPSSLPVPHHPKGPTKCKCDNCGVKQD